MDTLGYIRPKVYTLVIGQAFGNAAMIVASGAKGCRFATPNSRLMTAPPRINRNFGTTKNIMIRANELENNTQVRRGCSCYAVLKPASNADTCATSQICDDNSFTRTGVRQGFVGIWACTWGSIGGSRTRAGRGYG